MNPTMRAWTIVSYFVVIVMLLVALGFSIVYTMGDSLHLPFNL